MGKRVCLIVLDSVGCGNAPDAAAYGDAGCDTLGHLVERCEALRIPNLFSLGLGGILGKSESQLSGLSRAAFRLTERSRGKDTTTGHWELMGATTLQGFRTFESFPDDLVAALESMAGTGFLGNISASGTEILKQLGEQHLETGKPILYTSADSVLQIAAHEETFGLQRLYDLCRNARLLLDERNIRIGRVIARPFLGSDTASFKRTGNRHDYSLKPPETVLTRLKLSGVRVTAVGKISDIFADEGISDSHPTADNAAGMETMDRIWEDEISEDRFVFTNLVDFDSLYGHRRDPEGYVECLNQFDKWLGGFLGKLGADDVLIITADHGNDPFAVGTDHTREQVPCLVAARNQCAIPSMSVFSDVGKFVEDHFGIA